MKGLKIKRVPQITMTEKKDRIIAVIMTLQFLYFGCNISRKTAEGIPTCPSVKHKESVGIMTRYNDMASKGRSLESNILFKILNILEIAELAERIMNELISFLFIKDFLYVEFSSIIDEVGVGLS